MHAAIRCAHHPWVFLLLHPLITSCDLQHYQANATQVLLVKLVSPVHAASNGGRTVVEKVVVELTVTGAELLLLQEEAVVEQRQTVEDIELVLLAQDQGVADKGVQPCLKSGLVEGRGQADFGGVVPEVGGADDLVL